MYYIIDTDKTFEQATKDLDSAVVEHGFGVLHIHDLKQTLNKKGVEFTEECKVFEVCNPHHANDVLTLDMKLNMALPCRISVYTEAGTTKIGLLKPSEMLAALSTDPRLLAVAEEVEDKMLQMVNSAQ